MITTSLVTAAVTVALAVTCATNVHAEEWEVTLTPYIWAAGIDGDIEFGSESANVSASFSDIVENLNMTGMAMLEANNGRWVNWVQVDYLSLEGDDVEIGPFNGEIKSDVTMLAAGTGYRFQTSERSTIDLMVGLRYFDMDNELRINGVGERSGGADLVDAIITLRPRFVINERWSFSPTLSIGTGDTDVVWEMAPQFLYTYSETLDMRIGYRNLNYNFKDGSDEVDISIAGPIIGLGIRF